MLHYININKVRKNMWYTKEKHYPLRLDCRIDKKYYFINSSNYMINKKLNLIKSSYNTKEKHFAKKKILFNKTQL